MVGYTVNLAWLQPSTRDSQWVKYFKLVILEVPNVPFGSVFLKPVTFMETVYMRTSYTVARYVA